MQISSLRCAAVGACLLHIGAFANEPNSDRDETGKAKDDAEASPRLEEVIVTAHPLSGDALSEATAVLGGDALARAMANNIGTTVARQPGIHSASFGDAVGRPVVHGMSGPRVRVMEDRIDAMDVSATSGDHAVTVEPAIAEQVEMIKGPSTLLYGSGAIGGVVEVVTGRIPREEPDGLRGRIGLRAADNGDAVGTALRLDGGGGGFAWHIDGYSRDADEYEIPSFAESARRRAAHDDEEDHHDEDEHHGEDEDHDEDDEHHDEEDEHHDEEEDAFGVLPGSQAKAHGGALGFSWQGRRGFAGLAASRFEYDYGLPGDTHAHAHDEHGHEDDEHGHEDDEHEDEHEDEEHEEEEGTVTLALDQTRLDFEAALTDPFANFAFLNVRVGRNDYAHLEIEPNGEVGTRFDNRSFEARVELVGNRGPGWRSVYGLQFAGRDFSAIGEEAFVPPVESTTFGAFWLGEKRTGRFELETGLRAEHVRHEPTHGAQKRFTVFSASVGLATVRDAMSFGVHGGYSARAPGPEELYSNGPHLATASFEIGDAELDAEAALHGALTLTWRGELATVNATAYLAAWRDHIYQYSTGAEEDDLPVLRFGQEDAFYRGLDLHARLDVAQFEGGSLALHALFDTVTATIDRPGNDQLPRIPPRRAGLGLHLERGRLRADVDYLRVFAQGDVADYEMPTDAYDDLRLHLAVDVPVGTANARIFLRGRNLTDDEQRHHTSIVKDLAPAPGRTFEVGVRMAF